MRENELRIGNLVYHNDKIIEIKSLHPQDDDVNDEISFHSIFGIPLTEEWLLKFGFEEREFSFHKGSFYLSKKIAKNEFSYQLRACRFKVNFVHHLQNLYFVIKNQEL